MKRLKILVVFSETILVQILRYIESTNSCPKIQNRARHQRDNVFTGPVSQLEKVSLEFVMHDEFGGGGEDGERVAAARGFDLARIVATTKELRVFKVEFKEGLLVTPPVSFNNICSLHLANRHTSLATLVHIQVCIKSATASNMLIV